VSGLSEDEDEEIARVGIAAIGRVLQERAETPERA